jgi:exodeoxyribonuclease V alpha subunit
MIQLDPSQERAVKLIVDAPVACITGGAGTGKTTCLRSALDELDRRGQSYRLASPTGKAAKRMTEATGRPAMTIHRLLYWQGGKFQINKDNPLETSCVVVDEASMLDVLLCQALLEAIDPERTRVIFIGDGNQLAPVGAGQPFVDMIESERIPVARLTTLHRAAELSWINVAAQAVLKRQMPDLTTARADFRFVQIEDPKLIVPAITDLVAKVIPREIGEDAQVLIPQRPGTMGITTANLALQRTLNPPHESARYFKLKIDKVEVQLRRGDRVIQTKNNYKLEVFNGEIGTIVDVEVAGVTVQFPDKGEVQYSTEQANALQLAYALTVHKMQGSEFPWIVFVCHSSHTHMLSPQLIYTAITRGRKGVIIVGNEKGMLQGLRQANPPKRNSGLRERLRGEFAA